VPFLGDDGRPTLARVGIDCPKPGDLAGIAHLDVAERTSCFVSRPRMTFTALVEPAGLDSARGVCAAYADLVDPGRSCASTPDWLSRAPGYRATDPGDAGASLGIVFEPGVVDAASLPSAPTRMRVTGRFWHPEASDCEAIDPGTGDSLVWSPAAWRYCAAQFVVTRLEAAP
jgi:hypothetical protein